jgi:hypothetical protein
LTAEKFGLKLQSLCGIEILLPPQSEENSEMSKRSRSIWYGIVAGILCLAPAALAQTVDLQISDPPSSNVLDGIYVGSYTATNESTGGSVQITCDDFRDESNYNSETYTVNSFSSLGSTLWGTVLGTATATPLYEQAAWLTLQMLQKTGTTQGDYSYAIWAVFQPNQVANWLTSYGDSTACNAVFGNGSWNSKGCTAGSGGLVGSAESQTFTAGEFSNILILTPNGCTPASCPEQEFFEVVAEGGSAALYLLLAGTACFAAMFLRSRQRPSIAGSVS